MILQVEDCAKTYRIGGKKRTILDSLSLSVDAGELVSITGRSGGGKTTLLNVIAGIVPPEKGSVFINGSRMRHRLDPLASRMRNREIGFVFQTFRLLGDETVMANVLLPARIRGRGGWKTKEAARDLLGRLKMYAHRDMKASILSGGQKQRVAIARALINSPSLILADEPTANLDRETAMEIGGILSELRDDGKAVLVVTHDEGMHRRSDRVYTLTGGALAAYDPAALPSD
jgi:putative ABC transport system ATP-binding protein